MKNINKFFYIFLWYIRKNIFNIGCLMVCANMANMLLRFLAGIKEDLETIQVEVQAISAPALFSSFWALVGVLAYRKDGQYGAPPGMLYMQEKELLAEKEPLLKQNEWAESHANGSTRASLAAYGSE